MLCLRHGMRCACRGSLCGFSMQFSTVGSIHYLLCISVTVWLTGAHRSIRVHICYNKAYREPPVGLHPIATSTVPPGYASLKVRTELVATRLTPVLRNDSLGTVGGPSSAPGRCVPQTCNDGYHLEGGACLRGASGGPVSSGGAFVLWLFGIVVGAAAAAGFIYFKQKGGWRLGGQNFAMQLHDVPSGPSGFGSGFGLASAAATVRPTKTTQRNAAQRSASQAVQLGRCRQCDNGSVLQSSASAAQSHAAPGASLLDNLRSRAQSSERPCWNDRDRSID